MVESRASECTPDDTSWSFVHVHDATSSVRERDIDLDDPPGPVTGLHLT